MWRIEVQPAKDRLHDDFLNVLSPRLDGGMPEVVYPIELENGFKGVELSGKLILFAKEKNKVSFDIELNKGLQEVLVLNAPKNREVSVAFGKSDKRKFISSENGTLIFAPNHNIDRTQNLNIGW